MHTEMRSMAELGTRCRESAWSSLSSHECSLPAGREICWEDAAMWQCPG